MIWLQAMIDISIFQKSFPNITSEDMKQFLILGMTILGIIAIFPLFGGILSLKKKLWGIALASSIFGLSGALAMVIPGILSFIAMILLIISRNEFQ